MRKKKHEIEDTHTAQHVTSSPYELKTCPHPAMEIGPALSYSKSLYVDKYTDDTVSEREIATHVQFVSFH